MKLEANLENVLRWVHTSVVGMISVVFLVVSLVNGLESGLNIFAYLMVPYVLYLGVEVALSTPQPTIFQIPHFNLPQRIGQRTLIRVPAVEDEDDGVSFPVKVLQVINRQIQSQGDTQSIHGLVQMQMETIRRENEQRFARSNSRINAMAYAGFLGTMVGLMAFLADTDLLMKTYEDGGASLLTQINLAGIAGAFLTTFLGLVGKVFFAKIIEGREDAQEESLLAFERWLQDNVLARMHLPSLVTASMSADAMNAIAAPLANAVAPIETISQDMRPLVLEMRENMAVINATAKDQHSLIQVITRALAPALRRLATQVGRLDDLDFEAQYVTGGFNFRIRQRENTAPELPDLPADPDATERVSHEAVRRRVQREPVRAAPRPTSPRAPAAAPKPKGLAVGSQKRAAPRKSPAIEETPDIAPPGIDITPAPVSRRGSPAPLVATPSFGPTVGDEAEDTMIRTRGDK